MPQESLNIIFGALIGFVVSILTTWVNHIFQIIEKKEERKTKVKEQRFNTIEDAVNEVSKWLTKVKIALAQTPKKDKLDELSITPDVFNDMMTAISINTDVIGDKILKELSTDFVIKVILFYSLVFTPSKEFLEDKNMPIDIRRLNLGSEITGIIVKIYKRLDNLKNQI